VRLEEGLIIRYLKKCLHLSRIIEIKYDSIELSDEEIFHRNIMDAVYTHAPTIILNSKKFISDISK
jgi:hypothetical protein